MATGNRCRGGQSPQQGTDKVKEAGGGDQGIRD